MICRKRNLIRRTAGSKTKNGAKTAPNCPAQATLATGTRSQKHALQHHPILVLAVPVELQLMQGRPLPHHGLARVSSVDFFEQGLGRWIFLAGAGVQ